MKVDVVMPQMGESVVESTITKWYKEVGDHVNRDEELLELSADKVDADVPSPVSGILVEILYPAGDTVEVNTKIAVIETDADAAVDAEGGESTDGKAPEAVAEKEEPVAKVSKPSKDTSKEVAKHDLSSNMSGLRENMSAEEMRRVRSTPLVRRIAAEHGIDNLAPIEGTGLSGRVTRDDILAYIDSGSHQQLAPTPEGHGHGHGHGGSSCGHGGGGHGHGHGHGGGSCCSKHESPSSGGREIPKLPPIKVYPNDKVEVLSPQRQAIAKHMLASRATSPHAQTVHEVDFSAVFKHRKAKKAEFEARGARLTFTSYLVAAVAQGLLEFPGVNTSLDGTDLIYRGDVNVGIAVDVGDSLVVPVIKHADELSLLGISRAIEDLATRARTKKLTPDDMQAGTFTVSNHGIFGPEFGIPIINQPQTAIMSTGTIKKRVVVDQKTDAIMVRPTSIWCLSFDHRAIDGATADKFMARLREIIETWSD